METMYSATMMSKNEQWFFRKGAVTFWSGNSQEVFHRNSCTWKTCNEFKSLVNVHRLLGFDHLGEYQAYPEGTTHINKITGVLFRITSTNDVYVKFLNVEDPDNAQWIGITNTSVFPLDREITPIPQREKIRVNATYRVNLKNYNNLEFDSSWIKSLPNTVKPKSESTIHKETVYDIYWKKVFGNDQIK